MKTIRKWAALVLAVLTVAAGSVSAFAAESDFGSAAVGEGKTYTLSEMLTYAIEDEYLARAEYEEIIETFGAQKPFTNIIRAEETHISALEPLFTEYDVALPDNTAEEYVVIPASLLEAYRAGVEAEQNNLAMYEAFLEQDLPENVRLVFSALKNASENHLAAFERNVSRLESGTVPAAGNFGNARKGKK